ncbi:MAG: hypothetical protein CGU28_11240 [Candidatus Dactylopiibacterium carminicum]|uniref:histidine kinase n=1 Tax=Candidatus Dactylopiibacterium carminicum TaxID=857335 RepID=A0A272EME9_9RHOO|nr:ATP-binding protein [Candidatus Dactylopiibacterium carminicum]KAF7597675.1 hypothetical protein BGI27_17510 [Candidatus Dactylopiibacterium carminicum]PAS91294.1 MAG: hypothetical protein CGU29_17270 [Candidatus Dactylopiibacterium carminicum]PAS93773.1 MAG: hypothetical protein BSR46_17560 [Candidatus Dactylopiibacterium carminicum]PAS95877.1 MAG: hypothetical protein CGU28_11240 [Candidatus Dactylopiibacterium carminicum]
MSSEPGAIQWDQGAGIPESELESVFAKFVQGSAVSHRTEGAGLGLAICREIVVAHQGRIYAFNRVGGGAEFVVSLPLRDGSVGRDAATTQEKNG